MSFSQRKKSGKTNAATSLSSKARKAKKKHKTRLTLSYTEKEKEVQQLLDNSNLNLNLGSTESKDSDFDSQSIDFFCSERQTDTSRRDQLTAHKELDNSTLSSSETSQEEIEKLVPDTSSVSKTTPEQSEHSNSTRGGIQTQTASTFIQIDNVNEMVLTNLSTSAKYVYDDELLYQPKSVLPINIKLESTAEHNELTGNAKRMINRYYEESLFTEEKLNKSTISAIQAPFQDIKDPLSYRSFCLHEFHPIFCNATPNTVEIPTRQFVKIYFKELRFTQHPQLCEEHKQANELEDLYEEYMEREKQNVCEELYSKLQIDRNVVNSLLKHSVAGNEEETDVEHHFRSLQEHLFRVKEVRVRLYEESAYSKSLLKRVLDKWLQLKKLRQSQDYQCTRFKLQIKVEDLTSPMIARARQVWANRFQTDLGELYREELETYYSAKRLYKQQPEKNDKTLPKPKKPSLTKLSAELKEKYEDSFYMPEEPKIFIKSSRVSDEEFYENTTKMANMGSQQRRLKSFYLKIYFDREFVAETRSYRLEPDYSLRINEAIGIFLDHRLPQNIKIVLFEKSKLSTPHRIASIIVPLPTPSISPKMCNDQSSTRSIKFSSKKEPISGRLLLGSKCQEQNLSSEYMLKSPRLMASNQSNQNLNTESSDDDEASSATALRTCTLQETLLQFCNLADIQNNSRIKLLRSRYLKNDERTRDIRFVPAMENELEFDCESEDEDVIETGNWMDPIDLHKHRGKKYVKNLYEAVRTQCARLEKVIENTENLLIGDAPSSWSLFFEVLSSIFHPQRPLNPVRNSVTKSNMQSLQWEGHINFNIVLNVVRATGVPVRSYRSNVDTETGRQRSSGSSNMLISQNLKYSNVRPFVVLSYKDKYNRTISAEGSNPTWNEQLVLQLSGSLNEQREDIKISLYDEIIESHLNDDLSTVRNMDIYQRIQANWLADYRIPISTLLQQQKIEGTIEFNMPKILLGYKRPSLDTITTNLETNILVEMKESVQLFFYLSIEPGFELPSINTKTLECSELREVRQHLYEWSAMVRELRPERFIEPLVCTDDGKRICMTRLLEPVPLPFETSSNLLDSVCRYVALLNSIKQYDSCIGFNGVWFNNQVLLDTTWGSAKDLGVLLCNFLLALGLNSWLILGFSKSHGETTFVLYKEENGNLQIIDPCSGKRYFVKDIFCPLNKINYIVGTENIYCNIQSETRVTMMNFNLSDTACWLGAFSKRNPAPLGGFQKLNYSYHSALSTTELTKSIERKIIKKINSWRAMRKTTWNRAFQARLYSALLDLETRATTSDSKNFEESNYADQIIAEFPAHKLYGFAMNFSYTNLSAISERVRSTGIHLNSDSTVEFSLAVHVHSYPNNVLSVWIFLISIIPLMTP